MVNSASSDLSKLTVPQLKALCKERRITGYSKLTKAGLLQRLAESVHASAPPQTTPLQTHRATNNTPSTSAVSGLRVNEAQNPARPPATVETVHVPQPARDRSDVPTLTTDGTTTLTSLASELSGSSQNRPITGSQRIPSEKRPAHTNVSEPVPPKRTRISLTSETGVTNAGHETAVPRTFAPQKQVVDPSVPKIPEGLERSLHGSTSELSLAWGAPMTAARLTTRIPGPSQNRTVTSTTGVAGKETSEAKRNAHNIMTLAPEIRTGVSLALTTKANHPLKPSTPQRKRLVNPSVFKVPEVPAQPERPLHDSVAFSKKLSIYTINTPVAVPKTISQARFKPLKIKPMGPSQADSEPPRAPTASVTPLEVDLKSPTLSHISFPPKASERKRVHQWAVILSALCPTDRSTCTLVSRTFRYAGDALRHATTFFMTVYLSAAHLLSKNYAGRRLDAEFEQHPKNMTNFWPYLRFRMSEVSERRLAFKQSFLGRHTRSMGYDPLSEHLWTSPDDEKQVDVALRFILTRMWFALSIGAYGHDASRWSKCVIRDVREVVKGEIWQVVSQCTSTGERGSFYVLEATCEVIGQPPTSQGRSDLGYRLRADWSTWISQRSRAPLDAGPCSLLDYVKWSNAEDYHLGISKAWLRRVRGRDGNNVAKRIVAQKYILASVVANGISGQWMSTSAMAQEFAGLPDKGVSTRTAGRSVDAVNMYLPAHHHIESVHFTTAKGEALHVEVAVVQTPGREYYVLRDNGMQVGCEEEGIPEVWQQILGCDALGKARYQGSTSVLNQHTHITQNSIPAESGTGIVSLGVSK